MARLAAIFDLISPPPARLRDKLFRECNQDKPRVEKMQKLLKAGATLDVSLLRGPTHRNRLDIVQMLVDAGTPFDGKDYLGLTPLMQAVKGGHEELAFYYFRKGADFTTRTSDTFGSVLDAALEEYQSGDMKKITVAMLNAVKNDAQLLGRTLIWSAEENQPEIAKLVIGLGASAGYKDADGRDALYYAEKNGHSGVVDVINGRGPQFAPLAINAVIRAAGAAL